jgi:hypothetical protein
MAKRSTTQINNSNMENKKISFDTFYSNCQNVLKVPKTQYNPFGKFNYRKLETIMETLKPILHIHSATLKLSDEICSCEGILFTKATAELTYDGNKIIAVGCAGIETNKKGMDLSQAFGSSSTYARKYALNGMFLIDDSVDPDSVDNTSNNNKQDLDKSTFEKMINHIKNESTAEYVKNRMSDYSIGEKMLNELTEKLKQYGK